MKVILISGKAQHGKDTSAAYIRGHLIVAGIPRERILITHYGDLLKWVATQYFNWDGNKDAAGRTLLQTIGQRVRDVLPDYWCEAVWKIVSIFAEHWDYVLVPDVRYPNEIQAPHSTLGPEHSIVHLRVCRPHYDNGLTPSQKMHDSETALDEVIPDRYIDNSKHLTDLWRVCKNIVKELIEDENISRNQPNSEGLES